MWISKISLPLCASVITSFECGNHLPQNREQISAIVDDHLWRPSTNAKELYELHVQVRKKPLDSAFETGANASRSTGDPI